MRKFAVFAIVCFHTFIAIIGGVLGLQGTEPSDVSTLASYGASSAATLWWIADASVTRTPIPFASLWNGGVWHVTIPAHYLGTRGRRGLPKLLLHAAIAIAVAVAAGFAVEPIERILKSRITAADRALGARFKLGPDVLTKAKEHGANLRPFAPSREAETDGTLQGIMFDVESRGRDAVTELRPLLAKNQLAFIASHSDPFTDAQPTVAVVVADNAYDVMRVLQTSVFLLWD